MDVVQSILNSILFTEKFEPPNLSHNPTARTVHDAFWDDAYHRNLRLDHAEVEIRLGKVPSSGRGPFDTTIPVTMFRAMMESLQSYTQWTSVTHTSEIVGYFPQKDESVRLSIRADGTQRLISKQKIMHADFRGVGLPLDFRLAISLEIPITDGYRLDQAGRVVLRERHSFTLNSVRYDLTKLTHNNGLVEHQVELELVDLCDLQLTQTNAQPLAMELQAMIVDILNAVEPIRTFHCELVRKRYF